MMSNLGGIPALFIVIGATFAIWRIGKTVSAGRKLNKNTFGDESVMKEVIDEKISGT